MINPVLVYLDSSDYSRLSDPRYAGDAELSAVREFLIEATRNGTIEVRYSIVHVVEACHHTPESRAQATLRAELISALSGKRVMGFFSDVLRDEICRRSGDQPSRRLGVDDEGRWHPDYPDLGKEVQDAIMQGVCDALVSVPKNRNERRRTKARFGTPDKLRAGALRELAKDRQLLDALAAKHGMSPKFVRERLLGRWLTNRSAEDTDRDVRDELFDPVSFISHYVDRLDLEGRVRGSVTSLGERLLQALGHVRSVLREIAMSKEGSAIGPEVVNYWRAGAEERKRRMRDSLLVALLKAKGEAKLADMQACPLRGLDTLVEAIECWLSKTAGQLTPRNPKRSDAGDLLHLFYLPYVDLWRGDAYSADIANRIRSFGDGQPVARLQDLPEAVAMIRGSAIQSSHDLGSEQIKRV
jgi:hypothetical protein